MCFVKQSRDDYACRRARASTRSPPLFCANVDFASTESGACQASVLQGSRGASKSHESERQVTRLPEAVGFRPAVHRKIQAERASQQSKRTPIVDHAMMQV